MRGLSQTARLPKYSLPKGSRLFSQSIRRSFPANIQAFISSTIDRKMDNERDIVLSVLAHPDDAEFLCAGTLIRLVQEKGWKAHIASMTPGDGGSMDMPAEEVARVRRQEGAQAAALLGATFHCLEEGDLRIFYSEDS